MKRFILHTIQVKPGAKIQFQIKLPSGIKGVKAIKVTHPLPVMASGRMPLSDREIGWLWLRVPDCRDVFYAEVLQHESFTGNKGRDFDHLSTRPGWYLSGSKHEFLTLNVPVSSTVIYGFYRDRQISTGIPKALGESYPVNIYLKIH